MAKEMVNLIFSQKLIKKPVIYTMAKKFGVIPNIRRARITDRMGEVTLELSGSSKNLQRARAYIQKLGVKIEPIVGDIVE